jgi:hypothetical protein
MNGLARGLVVCALCVAPGIVPTQVEANQVKQRVAFRVGKVIDGSLRLQPIYPAKLGVRQKSGDEPKEGELLTCYVESRKIVKVRDKEGEIEVSLMKLSCLDGKEFEVLGIEY